MLSRLNYLITADRIDNQDWVSTQGSEGLSCSKLAKESIQVKLQQLVNVVDHNCHCNYKPLGLIRPDEPRWASSPLASPALLSPQSCYEKSLVSNGPHECTTAEGCKHGKSTPPMYIASARGGACANPYLLLVNNRCPERHSRPNILQIEVLTHIPRVNTAGSLASESLDAQLPNTI